MARLITQRLYLRLNKLDGGVVWRAITFFRVVCPRPARNSGSLQPLARARPRERERERERERPAEISRFHVSFVADRLQPRVEPTPSSSRFPSREGRDPRAPTVRRRLFIYFVLWSTLCFPFFPRFGPLLKRALGARHRMGHGPCSQFDGTRSPTRS